MWAAFCRICANRYGFDPVADGEVTVGRLLGERRDAWRNVWRRFADAPKKYPNLPALLDRARPEKMTLFEPPAPYWPQDNREQEDLLRESLSELSDKPGPEACIEILALEAEHGERRGWVWAEFGEAPLAGALLHLAALAEATKSLGSGTPEELAAYHASEGWKAYWGTLEALAPVETERDSAAVKAGLKPCIVPGWKRAPAVSRGPWPRRRSRARGSRRYSRAREWSLHLCPQAAQRTLRRDGHETHHPVLLRRSRGSHQGAGGVLRYSDAKGEIR